MLPGFIYLSSTTITNRNNPVSCAGGVCFIYLYLDRYVGSCLKLAEAMDGREGIIIKIDIRAERERDLRNVREQLRCACMLTMGLNTKRDPPIS